MRHYPQSQGTLDVSKLCTFSTMLTAGGCAQEQLLVTVLLRCCRYEKLSESDAEDMWGAAYTAAGDTFDLGPSFRPGQRFREVLLIGGLVLPVWNVVRTALSRMEKAAERRMQVLRIQTTGERGLDCRQGQRHARALPWHPGEHKRRPYCCHCSISSADNCCTGDLTEHCMSAAGLAGSRRPASHCLQSCTRGAVLQACLSLAKSLVSSSSTAAAAAAAASYVWLAADCNGPDAQHHQPHSL